MRSPLLVALLLAAACAQDTPPSHAGPSLIDSHAGPSLIDAPLSEFPARLSATGLFADVRDPESVHARAVAYAPQFALWSNGSDKQRYLVLPEGERIAAGSDGFVFPKGTLFFKTFAFAGQARADASFYAELRVMRNGEEGWEFAAYRYAGDRKDGELLDGRLAQDVPVTAADGGDFAHAIPSTRQCRTCHESSPSPVLGFGALQLDYDDGEGNALERLQDAGLFRGEVAREAIAAHDAETAWLLGYVTGNCTHCHNGAADLDNSSYDLRHPVFLENTVGRETDSSASGLGLRIAPGDPDQSVLYLAFIQQDNGTDIEPMPPLGVQLRDEQAAARLRTWITSLAP